MTRMKWLAALSCCIVFGLSIRSHAQVASIDPASWDFGPVAVGADDSTIFRFTNPEPTPLQIYDLTIVDNPHAAFAITDITWFSTFAWDPASVGAWPSFFFQGDYLEATVTFTPPAAGPFDANLQLHSNDHLREYIDLPLSGTGVPAVPAPSALALVLTGAASVIGARRRRAKTA